MKKIMMLLSFMACIDFSHAVEMKDSLLVVFWNMENFYDYIDQNTGESDNEFSSMGARHWTKKRFYRKCDDTAKAIFWIADKYCRMPDIIGMAEIENRGVLSRMLAHTLLRKYDYAIIHSDSKDRRGIDVAVLYRKSILSPLSISTHIIVYEGDTLNTRDILHVKFGYICSKCEEKSVYDVIVNHHPSKYGGSTLSEGRRTAAMTTLKNLCDSLMSVSETNVIAMGDFNDTPDADSFEVISDLLVNKGYGLHEKGEGTIRYEGKWNMIDMFLVSRNLESCTSMEVCRIPFLMTWENRHPGEKPLRTYSGPRYLGGVSDHFPVVLIHF